MRRLAIIALAVAAVALTALSGVELERQSADRRPGKELLYLPNGRHLKLASLGQAPVVADMIYLWAIQFYGNYEREDRFLYVEHIFREVIAELDPQFIDPYWIGALIMSVEARDVEGALRLLDRGIANNPDEWRLPFIAAWECYHAGQYERAKSYFEIAERVPGAPLAISRMKAGMAYKAGRLREAIKLWVAVIEDPDSDAYSRAIAEKQIRRLTIKADVQELQLAVDRFRKDNQRHPTHLAELLERSYIGRLPEEPDGRPYNYDAVTGRVSSHEERILGDDG
jgi:tetratricopeptide (TPR) repeat protein